MTSQIPLFPLAPHLVILDGNNIVHRTFHAPAPTPAIERFGFMIGSLHKKWSPTHAVIVWDPDDDSLCWRRQLWPGYKAGRKERPEGLDQMFEAAQASCEVLGLAQAARPDAEADDIIGAYTEAGVAAGLDVTIISSDKDMLQLIRAAPTKVRMRDDARKRTWEQASVFQHFGVRPSQFADYLALIGDSTDGYPGVPGVGEKTARTLLAQHGTFDEVLTKGPVESKGALRKRLLEHADVARTCYALACLRLGTELPVPLEKTRFP